jgi:hypothetical protein
VPCPPAIRETRGILEVSLRGLTEREPIAFLDCQFVQPLTFTAAGIVRLATSVYLVPLQAMPVLEATIGATLSSGDLHGRFSAMLFLP